MNLILFSLSTACLAHFFQKCQEEGHIFYAYSKWLDNLPEFLSKPLGHCIYCNGTWMFIAFFLAEASLFPHLEHTFISFFLGMGINYIWIEIITKIIDE